MLSMMMGLWLATSFIGNFLAGTIGTYWSSMTKPSFFLMLSIIAAASGLFIMLLQRPLRGVLPD